ncbi:MAG: UDP-N-acetylmuramate dehydrogenase [Lachnospiraceae bacterium]|nr:UDP-N-acetylmuramate dehydrogenase [Lachnospiraceae bacterium]
MSEAIINSLVRLVDEERVLISEPMKNHTTFRIGGEADAMVRISDKNELSKVLRYLSQVEIPYYIIGNGSNLLVADEGYRGVIIEIADKMNEVRVEGSCLVCQAGALMSKIARIAYENGLTGLEFAAGIPGTIGGGTVMNAGAYGGELKHVVTQVTVVNKEGEELIFTNEDMEFGYRTSLIKKYPYIVTEVKLQLEEGDKSVIKETMDDLAARRRDKQPLEYPSAGSTFKRPEGYFAGALIQDAGLKGYTVGGAQVSEKHSGFVINKCGATSADVRNLMAHVQKTVKEKFDVTLEPEVIYLDS